MFHYNRFIPIVQILFHLFFLTSDRVIRAETTTFLNISVSQTIKAINVTSDQNTSISFNVIVERDASIKMVPYKENFEFPIVCKIKQSETNENHLREEFSKCRESNIVLYSITIKTILTRSKEFCCFLQHVLRCETKILERCDVDLKENNHQEMTKMIENGCIDFDWPQCDYLSKTKISKWTMKKGIKVFQWILSILGSTVFFGFLCHSGYKYFNVKYNLYVMKGLEYYGLFRRKGWL
ncbi:hypothetical protein NH340_JMT07262 [Sarcoptes scabiei]|nr:hypothetical protein NH340_JMT07262 [Sarcoptes scabiei]